MTWDRLEQVALGQLGMSLNDYYSITLRSLVNKIKGFNELQSIEENRIKILLSYQRIFTALNLAPHLKKGAKLEPEKLVKFYWEETPEEKEKAGYLTAEERRKIFGKRDAKMKRIYTNGAE